MKLGEKLQQLRKKSGLSQEQLAARLTVSRQAVSKWELNETMPDTENVVQLSRLFGVSCDYLLRDEVDEQGAALPAAPPQTERTTSAAPGEARLPQRGWINDASALSLALCAIGLVVGCMSYVSFRGYRSLAPGLVIQILGLALFELAVPRMGDGRELAHLDFYRTACWLVLPFPVFWGISWVADSLLGWQTTFWWGMSCYFAAYLLLGGAAAAVLSALRRRMARQK